jgi:hypothetical protein
VLEELLTRRHTNRRSAIWAKKNIETCKRGEKTWGQVNWKKLEDIIGLKDDKSKIITLEKEKKK